MYTTPTLPERIITAESGLAPVRHAASRLIAEAPQALRLAFRFFLRDTRADVRQSLLGYFWLVVPPLGNTLIWVFLDSQEVVQIESGSVPYPVFVLTGSILWNAFNGAMMSMLGVINAARGVLAKVSFPQESLVYSAFMKSMLEAAIPLILLIPTVFVFRLPLRWEMLLFPVALISCIVSGAALGLIALPIGALFSDVGRAIQVVLRFGFFLTPVIYPVPTDGLARSAVLVNPVAPLLVTGRDWLTGSGEALLTPFFVLSSILIVLAGLGLLVFKLAMPHLVERLGA